MIFSAPCLSASAWAGPSSITTHFFPSVDYLVELSNARGADERYTGHTNCSSIEKRVKLGEQRMIQNKSNDITMPRVLTCTFIYVLLYYCVMAAWMQHLRTQHTYDSHDHRHNTIEHGAWDRKTPWHDLSSSLFFSSIFFLLYNFYFSMHCPSLFCCRPVDAHLAWTRKFPWNPT